jgi:hypothetical protein
MTLPDPILTRRAALLVKMESAAGVDASPAASDALMVSEPAYTINPTVLERNFVRDDISPQGKRVGRVLAGMTFGVELRGNNAANSGLIGNAPRIGRLLRACGFSETAITGSGRLGEIREIDTHAVLASFATGGSVTSTDFRDYLVTCVLGGASATAKLRVTELNGYDSTLLKNETFSAQKKSAAGTVTVDASNPLSVTYTIGGTWAVGDTVTAYVGGEKFTHTVIGGGTATTAIATALASLIDAGTDIVASASTSTVTVTFSNAKTGTVITSGSTALAIGNSGATITPTWTGNLALGQQWKVRTSPAGIQYAPVSSGFETATLYMYFDGILHKLTGAMGTFSISSEAGQYGTINFEFTGQYNDPEDKDVPNAVYEAVNLPPPIFELAKLRMDSEDITVQSLNFTQNNQIVPRPDANSSDGYAGVRLVARSPEGGVNPEARRVSEYDFWAKMKAAAGMNFSVRWGTTAGNVVWMKGPSVQYTGLTYQDRDGMRVYDAALAFTREGGDDEVVFHFA